MRKSKNITYMLIQMFFWMIYCSCFGFASYYLVEKGFGTSVVGIVTAVAGIISAIGQPVLGGIADRVNVGYKKPLMVLLVMMSICSVVLTCISGKNGDGLICVLYGLVMLILGLLVPLINAAGVSFADEVNFGMARGTGSFGYAMASYVIGYMTAAKGSKVIPIFILAVSLMLFLASFVMPNSDGGKSEETDEEESSNKDRGFFLRKYPVFTFLWIVLIFMLTVHNLSNTYLLQILQKAGGDSHSLGIAVAIAAIMEIPMIFFYEKVNKYISTPNLILIAAATYLLRSIFQLINNNLFVFYLIQLLQLTSWGIYASASVYFAKEVIPQKDQTKAQAYMTNALTIGTVIGTFAGGQLIEKYNVNVMLVFQNIMALISLIGIVIWKIRIKSTYEGKA